MPSSTLCAALDPALFGPPAKKLLPPPIRALSAVLGKSVVPYRTRVVLGAAGLHVQPWGQIFEVSSLTAVPISPEGFKSVLPCGIAAWASAANATVRAAQSTRKASLRLMAQARRSSIGVCPGSRPVRRDGTR